MFKRILKIFSIGILILAAVFTLTIWLFRTYSPRYIAPYLVEKVRERTSGRYTLTMDSDSLKLNLLTMDFKVGHLTFMRDTSVTAYSGIDLLDKYDVFAELNGIHFKTMRLYDFLLNGQIRVEELSIIKPGLVVRQNTDFEENRAPEKPADSDTLMLQSASDSLSVELEYYNEYRTARDAFLPILTVKRFSIDSAYQRLYLGDNQRPFDFFAGLDFNVSGFQINDKKKVRFEDGNIYLDTAMVMTGTNTAMVQLKGVGLQPDLAHITAIRYHHIVDRYRINRIKGFRASWLDIMVRDLDIQGIHPAKLISDSVLYIDKASIGHLNLYLFKDKSEEIINPEYKPLLAEAIRSISFKLALDSIEIRDGKIFVEMQAARAKKPGHISLDKLKLQILNVTNDPEVFSTNSSMSINANFRVMDSAYIEFKSRIILDDPLEKYQVAVAGKPFNATILNDFLGSQFFIEFASGNITDFGFEYEGNKMANVGTLDIGYNKLRVRKLKDFDTYIDGKPKTGFIAGIGNILLNNNRSLNDKTYKPGVIYYEKENNRDYIHGVIMSMLSGIESSLGFGSKNLEKKEQQAAKLEEPDTLKMPEENQGNQSNDKEKN